MNSEIHPDFLHKLHACAPCFVRRLCGWLVVASVSWCYSEVVCLQANGGSDDNRAEALHAV